MSRNVYIFSSVAVVLLFAVSVTPVLATCPAGLIQLTQHSFGGLFNNCPDAQPVTGRIYVLGSDSTINSNDVDFVCENSSVPTSQGGVCQPEAGTSGDGNVTVLMDWAGAGNFPGCPNAGGVRDVGRNLIQVIGNDGSGVLVTVGYSPELGQFAVDCAAVPLPTGLAGPISCSHRDAGLSVTSLDSTTLCTNQPPCKIFSDCDAGTFCGPDNALGLPTTCNPAQIPSCAPGRLYKKDAPCKTSPDPRLSAGWALLGTPDASGNLCVPVPRPADPSQCAYIGASGIIGGVETQAAIGSLQVAGLNAPSARALDVRAAAATGDVVISWRTESELDLGGFNILADTKGKGRIKVNDVLIVPKGVNGAGARYEDEDAVSIPRGKFLGGRTLYVESVLNSGAKILSDPAKF